MTDTDMDTVKIMSHWLGMISKEYESLFCQLWMLVLCSKALVCRKSYNSPVRLNLHICTNVLNRSTTLLNNVNKNTFIS